MIGLAKFRMLVVAGLAVLAAGQGVAQNGGAGEARIVIMDYSGSMWANTGQPRAPEATEDHKMYNRAEELAGEVVAKLLADGSAAGLGLTPFGQEGRERCGDPIVPVLSADRPFSRDIADAFLGELEWLRPAGQTPLEEAIRVATDDAKRLIETGTWEKVRLVVISDMQDTCIDDVRVARPTKDQFCAWANGSSTLSGRPTRSCLALCAARTRSSSNMWWR